jgi:hypothetical protein
MQEAQIAELTRERDALLKNVVSVDLEKSKEKLRQGRQKKRKRRDSLDKVNLEQLRKEEEKDRQLPS